MIALDPFSWICARPMPDSFHLCRSSRRRRTVALRVMPDGGLTVQAPMRTSLKWIEAFVKSRADWIEHRREEAAKKRLRAPTLFVDGSPLPFLDEQLTLKLSSGELAAPQVQENTLHLTLAAALSPEAQQAEIRTELALWYKKQARSLFQDRLTYWAELMDVRPTRFVLNAPKQQWGSCNPKNEIRLNWRLIMGKAAWLDYVIVHELAHIKHKNHGPRFWHFVERFIPDFKARRKALHNWKGEHGLES